MAGTSPNAIPGFGHPAEIAVYAGRQRLGYVVEEAAKWVASTDGGRVLGRYPTEKAAVQAIVMNEMRVR